MLLVPHGKKMRNNFGDGQSLLTRLIFAHERESNHILRTWEDDRDKNHHPLHAYCTLSAMVSVL